MSRLRPAAVVVALASCLSFLSGGSAWASTTVGQGFFAPDTACTADTFLQSGVSAGNSYTVPSAGVITSWSFHDGAPIVSGLKLKVGRPSPSGATIVGDSAAPAFRPQNQINGPYPTRIPVLANDAIGIYTSATLGPCSLSTSNTADTYFFVPGDVAPNTFTTGSTGNSFRFPVVAFVEPDADNDGFGDESQDFCKTDATTQGPCRSPGSLTFGPQGVGTQSSSQTVTFLNTSPTTPLSISSISAGGDFVVTSNGCGVIGPAEYGSSCVVGVAFGPRGVGARAGTLSIADTANGSPQAVALSGTGATTGLRAAALAKCKHKHGKKKRRKCRNRANLLPV
jgi:hypothetical protein